MPTILPKDSNLYLASIQYYIYTFYLNYVILYCMQLPKPLEEIHIVLICLSCKNSRNDNKRKSHLHPYYYITLRSYLHVIQLNVTLMFQLFTQPLGLIKKNNYHKE